MGTPDRLNCSELVIRWKNPHLDDPRANEIATLDFRAFEIGHRDLLDEGELRLLRENPDPDDVWGFDWLPLPPHRLDLYAFYQDLVIGHLALHVANHHDHYAVVEPMNVAPEYRGRGVGSCLWDYLLEHAHAMGTRIAGIQVWAINGNTDAIRFYGSRPGAVRIGTAEWWIGYGKTKRLPATGFQVDFDP